MFDKVFFVLAPSYQGSTLLAKLINAHPEVTTLGDTYPCNAFDQVCGCGARVSACHFWQAVKSDTGAERYKENLSTHMLPTHPGEGNGASSKLTHRFLSLWSTPGILRFHYGSDTLASFRKDYEAFLESVHRHTPKPGHVLVDGVKSISRMENLRAAGLHVDGAIHMTRDPADFVSSSIRNTGRGGWRGVAEHALRYRLCHARARQAAGRVGSVLELRHEDMSMDIDRELARLFRFLGVAPLTMAQLRQNFDSEWHYMGIRSLFDFDGTIRPSRHTVSKAPRRLIRAIAGA